MGYSFRVADSKFVLLDENARYPIVLYTVEEDELEFQGTPQPKFKFTFIVLHPEEFEGRRVNGIVNIPAGGELNPRHFLYQWIAALSDGVPPSVGDDLDFPAPYLGKIVLGKVKNTTKNYQAGQRTFQNVREIIVCTNQNDYAAKAKELIEKARREDATKANNAVEGAIRTSPPAEAPRAEMPTSTPQQDSAPPPTQGADPGVSTVDGEMIPF